MEGFVSDSLGVFDVEDVLQSFIEYCLESVDAGDGGSVKGGAWVCEGKGERDMKGKS